MRAADQSFYHGDRVYYKHDGRDRWLGPGKVVFQDGKVVFVRHGGSFVRVSPNRLIKAGTELTSGEGTTLEPGKEKLNDCREAGENDSCDNQREDSDEQLNANDDHQNENTEASENDLSAVKEIIHVTSGDRIEYKVKNEDDFETATVLGRAGKATGDYRNWYNIRNEKNSEEKSIDLASIAEWKKINEAEVDIVMVPKNQHGEGQCMAAKQTELTKLADFETYELVEDVGQNRISTAWVLWWKGNEVRARLVARGFEEEEEIRADSPTVGKSVMRLLLVIAASKHWTVKTTDIKSAFLQGRRIDREVYITPPKEAEVERGKLWKLKRCLYGLNDAARHFYQGVVEAMK